MFLSGHEALSSEHTASAATVSNTCSKLRPGSRKQRISLAMALKADVAGIRAKGDDDHNCWLASVKM
jgi:hypothetical protein